MTRLLRSIALLLLLVTAEAASAGPVRLGDGVAFEPRVGFNTFALGGPVPDSNGVYLADPYTPSAWGHPSQRLTSALVSQVKAAGFKFARVQVSIGPCVQVVQAGGSHAILDAANDAAINAFLSQGMGVIWSPYISGYTATDAYANYQQGVTKGLFPALLACERHWAARYKNLSPRLFAIDAFNEPTLQRGSIWQTELMPALFDAVRAEAPNITQVIEVENYSDFNILAGVNPSYSQTQNPANGLDPRRYTNALFSLHQFLPYPFVYQGAAYSSPARYLTGISFPPNPAEKAGAIARMQANVAADTSLTATQRDAIVSDLTTQLGYYYDLPQGRAWLSAIYDQVSTWARYWGVPASSILVGEYAPVRQNPAWIDSAGRPQGPDRVSRANYFAMHASVAMA
ncbi:MAG: hypothetical protein EOO66_14780, partial [Methylobacterium sp.]